MILPKTNADAISEKWPARVLELFREQQQTIFRHADHLFSILMVCQWVAAIGLALWVSPLTWAGIHSQVHPHVWMAIFLGGLITALPVALARFQPGKTLTRHTIAIGQVLMSAILIHVTGGRIETHFHVFGSLAILAFYRDWRVLISASVVVYLDHLLRGMFWPQSVYGVLAAPIWRSLEHGGWVIFEVTFLIISIEKSLGEMRLAAERQAKLEAMNESIEQKVAERTIELRREIAERRQTEARLTHSEGQLAEAQELAQVGSWEWNVIQDKVTWSEQTRRMYGFTPDEAGASLFRNLQHIHPGDRLRVQQAMAESLQTLRPYQCDHRVLLADGLPRTMRGLAKVVVDEQGRPTKMIGTVQDITETRRAEEALRASEEKLRQSQKMEAVGRLAGGVAHDFNNLLTVIGGYCEMSLARLDPDHWIRKSLEEVSKASARASALTSQLLAFSRKQVLQPKALNLSDVVQGMEKMIRRLVGEDVELRTVLDNALGNVKADQGQLEQVILNLAVNARDAMPLGGKLTISTTNITMDEKTNFLNRTLEVGDYVMLAVSDSGTGMTDEVKAHLFEPFFTTKGVGKGTGLGLATCYGIISQSGGDIRFYSEPNSGTTFKIYLPRTEAEISAVEAETLLPLPDGNESVLIVEDDASVRGLTVKMLEERGYRVHQSSNGAEALAMIKDARTFDLVITDVIMPQMSGRELYDRIKQHAPATRVLFISGYTDDALAHHGVLSEGLSFLEKPFSTARLAHKVREVLREPVPRADEPHFALAAL